MSMKTSDRLLALIAYLLPVLGWIFIGIFQRRNAFAMFHLRQAIGIFLALLIAFLAWVVVGWVVAWIPYGFVFSMALFSLVIVVVIAVAVAWIVGIVNALLLRKKFSPIIGRWADRLPL
jgi:uncharacterized membrane protein